MPCRVQVNDIHYEADFLIGITFLFSREHRNWKEAVPLLRDSNISGSSKTRGDAAFCLALAHERGCGVAVDTKEAEQHYLAAAKWARGGYCKYNSHVVDRMVAEGVCH